MKKILLGVFAAIAMIGCTTDNSDHPHVDLSKAKPAEIIPMSVNKIVLEKQIADAEIALSWKPADYGYSAAVTYTVEADVAGGDFSKATELFTSNSTSERIKVSKLNGLLVSRLGFEPAGKDEPAIIYVMDIRVTSSVSNRLEKLASEVYTIYVTTYQDKIIIPSLGVPGSYVPVGGGDNNWNPGNPLSRVWDVKQDKFYVGYINMTGGNANLEFKFVNGTTWDDPALVSPPPALADGKWEGTFEEGRGDNITGVTHGYYRIVVNLAVTPGTFSMLEFTSLGIVGDAAPNGWDNNNATMLTYNPDNGLWELKDVTLGAGELLILANKNWDQKFAIKDGNLTFADGSNIPSPGAGTYDLTVDLQSAIITYEFIAK